MKNPFCTEFQMEYEGVTFTVMGSYRPGHPGYFDPRDGGSPPEGPEIEYEIDGMLSLDDIVAIAYDEDCADFISQETARIDEQILRKIEADYEGPF